jgi:hypothetical protein
MRLLVFILFFAIAAEALAQPFLPHRRAAFRRSATGGGDCTVPGSPLLHETYEGAGYSNGGWTETGTGTIDEDYTTSPAPLVGSQSVYFAPTSGDFVYNSHTFTSGGDRYGRAKINVVNLPSGTHTIFQFVGTATFVQEFRVYLKSSGKISVSNGSVESSDTTDAITSGTYTIWWRFSKGSGANGVGQVGFASDCTRPTSGTNFASVSNGTSTADVNNLDHGCFGFSGTPQIIMDEVIIDDVAID